ncbi:MAG: N-acetyl sugar amidotransferase [Magnetospirillum sp.]|nr:N-acetyl sugar amidotransferase [Magnetospirillum sp.]
MQYCRHCLESTARPGQSMDESGLCVPCQYALNVRPVDWDARRAEIQEIAAWAKRNKTGKYDCVLGVSGGKDSVRLACFCREVGLEPLLVSSVPPPQMYSELGAKNLANIVELGFDLIYFNVSPDIYSKLMRRAFLSDCNYARATELALVSSMPRTALRHGIPLCCAGENPYVTMGSVSGSEDGDASNILMMNTLKGGDLSHLISNEVSEKDLYFFRIPKKAEMEANGLRFIWLGYYIEDYGPLNNAEFAMARGMEIRTGSEADPSRTGFLHPFNCLEHDFVFVHQFLKFMKLGFGAVSQWLSIDIREGRIARDEAIELAKKYDGKCDGVYIEAFCKFIDITIPEFWETVEKFRNPELWSQDECGNWIPPTSRLK